MIFFMFAQKTKPRAMFRGDTTLVYDPVVSYLLVQLVPRNFAQGSVTQAGDPKDVQVLSTPLHTSLP